MCRSVIPNDVKMTRRRQRRLKPSGDLSTRGTPFTVDLQDEVCGSSRWRQTEVIVWHLFSPTINTTNTTSPTHRQTRPHPIPPLYTFTREGGWLLQRRRDVEARCLPPLTVARNRRQAIVVVAFRFAFRAPCRARPPRRLVVDVSRFFCCLQQDAT